MSGRHGLGALVLAGALAAGPGAAAQDAPMEAPPMETPSVSYSDEKLEAFAGVAIEIQGVVAGLRQEVAQAEDEEAKRAILEEGNQRMAALIQEQPGITRQEYQAIARKAQTDEEFKARVDAIARAKLEERGMSTGAE